MSFGWLPHTLHWATVEDQLDTTIDDAKCSARLLTGTRHYHMLCRRCSSCTGLLICVQMQLKMLVVTVKDLTPFGSRIQNRPPSPTQIYPSSKIFWEVLHIPWLPDARSEVMHCTRGLFQGWPPLPPVEDLWHALPLFIQVAARNILVLRNFSCLYLCPCPCTHI